MNSHPFSFLKRQFELKLKQFNRIPKSGPGTAEVSKDKEEQERLAHLRAMLTPVARYGSYLPRNPSASDSRQVRRRLLRVKAFNFMTDKYAGEPRRIRRSMAFDYLRNIAKGEKIARGEAA